MFEVAKFGKKVKGLTHGFLSETVRFNGINFTRANKLKEEVFM